MNSLFARALAMLLLAAAHVLHAQVPQLLNYQGRVAVGGVNFNGPGSFKFALVNTDGSITYWSNDGTSTVGDEPTGAVSLTVAVGLYSVMLGDSTLLNMAAIPPEVFANPDVRLRVWFDDGTSGSQLLAPDQRLAPAMYLADGAVTPASIAAGAVGTAQLAANLTLGGTTAGTFSGPLFGDVSGSAADFTGSLAGDVTGTQGATVVGAVGGVSATDIAAGIYLANTATPANTPNAAVLRDANGNFNAGSITLGANLAPPSGAGGDALATNPGGISIGAILVGDSTLLHYFGTANLFVGIDAGNLTMTGAQNTGSGQDALASNTDGSNNTATGAYGLAANTTGAWNTATGANAMNFNTTGSFGTAIGTGALFSNTSGSDNTASGYRALSSNTTGSNNTASGLQALNSNNGNANTASGVQALFSNTAGHDNTANGFQALYNTTGSANIGIGSAAGSNLTSSSNNICIGNAGVAGDSGAIRIGTSGTHSHTYLAGDVQLQADIYVPGNIWKYFAAFDGNSIPTAGYYFLYVSNDPTLQNAYWHSSDARLKQDVATIPDALGTLGRLRGVSYHWNEQGLAHLTRDIEKQWRSESGSEEDNRRLWAEKRQEALKTLDREQTGFIAQELEQVFPAWVRTDEKGYKQINVEQLTGVVVQGVNELTIRNEAQAATIAELKKRLAELEAKDKAREERLARLEQSVPAAPKDRATAAANIKAD